MPNRDKTGPNGDGPQTGKKAGIVAPKHNERNFGKGRGLSKGQGQGGGQGRGRSGRGQR